MDFSSSVSRFEKEAEKRKKVAKEKQRNEALARLRQQQVEKERQELALVRQAEREREQENAEQRKREESRLTGGVVYLNTLRVVFLEGEDDKVILPQSSLETLMNQNAFDLGPMCFRIWTHDQGSSETKVDLVSHCGVREFTAVEGTIQVPKKVLDSLGLSDKVTKPDTTTHVTDTGTVDTTSTVVTLKYILLSKVTSVRIQPIHNMFQHVGPVKLVLEQNLQHHSTLTVGDKLTVYYRGSEHSLVVKDLTLDSDKDIAEGGEGDVMGVMDVDVDHEKNEKISDKVDVHVVRGGTLINTDVVVDIDLSEEFQHNENLSTEKQLHAVSSGGRKLGGPPIGTVTNTDSSSTALGAISGDTESSPEPAFVLPEKEPEIGPGVVTCRVKTPNGQTFTRRFLHISPLLGLFVFVRRVLASGGVPRPEGGVLQLTTRHPVRKLTDIGNDGRVSGESGCIDCSRGDISFQSAGMDTRNEMFFVAYV